MTRVGQRSREVRYVDGPAYELVGSHSGNIHQDSGLIFQRTQQMHACQSAPFRAV